MAQQSVADFIRVQGKVYLDHVRTSATKVFDCTNRVLDDIRVNFVAAEVC